ncbi:uncharacterized protein IL334_003952 [Kwoniella shivajii]|uniref:ATP-dependent DNA helicase II subunit 2 n=1 Tax=Kwoniella shivajii TaxID=564305 RepID=A0ABZ1CYZ7_9TREE|nr:hypothetical protein IL334_003952 [Kwoniella shivajii]
MPSDRAGYTLSVFAIDVSPSMGESKADPGGGCKKPKLDLVKEYVARKCEPKISSGRKTEAVGILSYGGKVAETNNQANRAFVVENPDDEDPPYAAVSCDVAIQTAKPKTVEVVMNLDVGEHEGNPVSALMVALDMIHVHKHTKSWALEVILITDGESSFRQEEYEDAMDRFDDLGVRLSVVGLDFQPLNEAVEKTKSRNKRLSEKFWRTFVTLLHERISKTTESEEMLPTLEIFDDALEASRLPKAAVVNGTVSGIDLHIGSSEVDPEQAITIPIKYSKATMKARPPTLSKAWKPAMDLQAPIRPSLGTQRQSSNQLMSSLINQSQSQSNNTGDIPKPEEFANLISADVKHHSTYIVKKQDTAPSATQLGSQGLDGDYLDQYNASQKATQVEDEEVDEEFVEKEDIVKAWRFGSTWVPMEADTFEPMDTRKGVEILGFFPKDAIKRHLLMGEVRFVWPDLTSPRGQIQFSALVEGMELRGMCAVVRWVLKDKAEPVIGLCLAAMEFPGEGKRLDFMYWIKLPFAEDEHNFWFPSLTTYNTATGKVITEHPLLPTEEQCELMDELVGSMDLDAYAKEQAKKEKSNVEGEEEDEDMADENDDEEGPRWFEPEKSYNPVIHRIKEAIFHASLTSDLDANPLGPPHPELVKYFNTPDDIGEQVEDLTQKLQAALDIKKIAPRTRKKVQKEGLREDEGFIDIDELFDETSAPPSTAVKGESSSQKPKVERPSPAKAAKNPRFVESDDEDLAPLPKSTSMKAKPKPGRLISNEQPLEDFKRLIEGEGDVFRKAIQDLGLVVSENIESSFSHQAFPLALDCLKEMRNTALTFEEVETYNGIVDNLEKKVKKGKHKDFWKKFEAEGSNVAKISEEEAQEALNGYE